MKNNLLSSFVSLSHQVKIYVPSTVEVNKEASQEARQAVIDTVLGSLSDLFGGATAGDFVGAWRSQEAGIVTEKTTVIYSFCTSEALEAGLAKVVELAQMICKDMSQEVVSLEIDNALYLVNA